jgi:membrane protease YdiL (CAAX protease family)
VKLPRPVAWLILCLGFLTAGILRRYHDGIPASPYVSPLVGSLLFAAILLLLLVASRERKLHGFHDPDLRIGILAPLLLMLLVEKWISVSLYNPVFSWLSNPRTDDELLDAQYRAFAGVALLLTCLLVSSFSPSAASRTWRRCRPSRWPAAAVGTGAVVIGTYALLGGIGVAFGANLELAWPTVDRLWLWVFFGQGLRALAEEVYYRGLLLGEMEHLGPRLGATSASSRRWVALLPTAVLFALEHVTISPPWGQMEREAIFTFSLGLLLGILVLVTNNLHFAAGVHAYVNWLLLGAAPRFLDTSGQVGLPPGTYVGVALILAFVLSYFTQSRAKPETAVGPSALGTTGESGG